MPLQNGLSACEQFVDPEGLEEIIVSTSFEKLHHFSRICFFRDDDNRDLRQGSDLRKDVSAIAICQFCVKNHQIGTREDGRFQSFFGGGGLRH